MGYWVHFYKSLVCKCGDLFVLVEAHFSKDQDLCFAEYGCYVMTMYGQNDNI